MGSVVFQAPLGGSTSLVGADTASPYSITIPAQNGLLLLSDSTTGATRIPAGTTAQRPGSPVTGDLRYNSTLSYVEVYTGTDWVSVGGNYAAYFVAVAGGGGGSGSTGAGGAGGYIENATVLVPGTTYTITIGAGGAAATSGTNTTGLSVTAVGGGTAATSGGSGGGANYTAASTVGSGTTAQGYAGGVANYEPGPNYCSGGGGGGANAAGSAGLSGQSRGGNGGAGRYTTITGTLTPFGGGGGGGATGNNYTGASSGGAGGGGAGNNATGVAGTINTGGGGGGGGSAGGAGGSGIFIMSIPTTRYTGVTTGSPTVSTSGSNTILQFTSSGTYKA